MVSGLLITSVVTLVMTAALFTRRSRSGWLHELDGIRGDALDHAGGGLAAAMAGGADPDERLDQPTDRAAKIAAVKAQLASTDAAASGTLPPTNETSWFDQAPTPHLVSPDDVSPDAASQALAPPQSTRPAPHPYRPEEMWHPGTERPLPAPMGPASVEERLDPAELDDTATSDDGAAPRFRFTRLGPDPSDRSQLLDPGSDRGLPVVQPLERANRTLDDRLAPGEAPQASEMEDADDRRWAAEPEPLAVWLDGTVPLTLGTLRVAHATDARVRRGPGGIVVELLAGWCWCSVGEDTTSVITSEGALAVPAGTTALVAVEADGSIFHVVVSGEAALIHTGGRLRLRAGSMVLTTPGGGPQADLASEEEIEADPLVARNQAIDAGADAASGMR
ncbi:hypothetical protein BH20ACT3_BH20ACT3_11410 [soil metagenome]